ncbi:MAG: WecB/TagA/CpsF family glycosyltransferase [Armatimonadota bacterium]
MANALQKTGCVIGALIAGVAIGGSVLTRRWKRLPVAWGRVELLEVPVDSLTMPEVLARVEEFIASGKPHHIFTADASGIMLAQADPQVLDIVRQADLITPDGAGVLVAASLRGVRLPERVSGVDLVERISALAAEKGYRVYLFGAAEGVATAAADALTTRYPGLQVAGTRNGYFIPEDESRIVAEIAEARPDVLFVALGIPKQEQFIRNHFAELGVPVMIGIGGSFDVISGQLKRAPGWMQHSGMEWLFRLLQQPSRLPRLAALPRFILAAMRSKEPLQPKE